MRKLSKILAVLLALCLICGAIVMSVGATTDSFTISQNTASAASSGKASALALETTNSSVKTYVALDMETNATGKLMSHRANKANAQHIMYGGDKRIMYDVSKTVSLGGAAKNTYFCYQAHGIWAGTFVDGYGATLANNYQFYFSENAGSSVTSATLAASDYNVANNSFGVIDFDFATDRLKYQLADGSWRVAYPDEITFDKKTQTGTDRSGAAITNVNLAYHTNNVLFAVAAYGSAGNQQNAVYHTVKFVEEEGFGVWSVYVGGVDTGKDLTSGVLEWNHFTAVIANTGAKGSEAMFYLYLDGECIYKAVANSNANADTKLFLRYVEFSNGGGELQKFNKSVAIDNITANYYAKGYTGELAAYFASEGSKEVANMAPIYNCDDIIYNAAYAYAYPSSGTVKLNDTDIGVTVPGAINDYLQENLEDDDVITLDGKCINDFVVPEGISSFKVDVVNGATFSLADGQLYTCTFAGTTYNVEAVSYDREIAVTFTDAQGNVLGTATYVYGQTIKDPGIVVPNSTTLVSEKDKGLLQHDVYAGWMWDLDGDGEDYGLQAIGVIDEFVYSELDWYAENAEGPMPLTIQATSTAKEVYDEVTGYVVYTGNPETGIEVFAARDAWNRADANTDSKNAPDGATFVLYVNTGSFNLTGHIAVGNGKALTFDMNGHYMRMNQNYGSGAQAGVFMVGNGSTLNLTSSRPGAEILHTYINNLTEGSGGAQQYINAEKIFSEGAIMFADVQSSGSTQANTDNTTININGTNILFNIGVLIRSTFDAEGEANHVNINGGTFNAFIKETIDNYGGVLSANDSIVYTIQNATIYTGGNALLATSAGKTSEIDATFTNCTIICEDVMFGKTVSTIDVAFNGCNLIGFNASAEFNGNVVLGAGNKVSGTYAATVADGVIAAYNNAEGVGNTMTFDVSYPKNFVYYVSGGKRGTANWDTYVNVNETKSGAVVLETYAEGFDPTANGYTKVEWLNLDNSVYTTQYWFPGSTIDIIPSVDFGGFVSNNDNWTGMSYNTWEGIKDAANLVVGAEAKTFTPALGYTANITGTKANLTLTGQVVFNLYIPVYVGEGFEFVGVSGTNSSGYAPVNEGIVTIGGASYVYISSKFAPYDFNSVSVTVNFKLNGVALSDTVELDIFKYADAVFAMPEYECGSEAATLLFDLFNFKKEAYIYKYNVVDGRNYNQDVVDRIDAYLADVHGAECTCGTDLDTLVFEEDTANARGTLEGKFTAVQYSLNGGSPTAILYFEETFAAGIVDVQVRFQNAIEGNKISALTEQVWSYVVDEDNGLYGGITKRSDNKRYDVCDVPMHMQACVMEITVITEEGSFTGLYSLAEYCQAALAENPWANEANSAMYEGCLKTAKAFYALSKSAYNYKTSPAN